MVCTSRDDVLEDDVNVWHGEETAEFQPKYDVVCVHGLGSHPYWAWLHEPSLRASRVVSTPPLCDSAVSLIPQCSRLPRFRLPPDEGDNRPIVPFVPNYAWPNDFSNTDALGRTGTFWPRDLLPLDLPEARICTLGYRSQWTSSKFQTSFRECGEHLLTVLEQSRQSSAAAVRPIIFIAHSFGGLVVQSALLTARMDDRFSSISHSVAGCLFLGCPFAGSKGAAYLNMATNISGNRQQILNSLRPGNPDLWTLQNDFLRSYRELPLVCFYEKIKSGLGRTIMIVPEPSARIPGAKAVALYKDHRGLNKFRSSQDESYVQVLSELKLIVKSVSKCGRQTQGNSKWRRREGIGARNQFKQLVKDTVLVNVHPPKFRERPLRTRHGKDRRMSIDHVFGSDANSPTNTRDDDELSGAPFAGYTEPTQKPAKASHPVAVSGIRSRTAPVPQRPIAANSDHGPSSLEQQTGSPSDDRRGPEKNTERNPYILTPGSSIASNDPRSLSRTTAIPWNLPPHLLLSYQALQEKKGGGEPYYSSNRKDISPTSPPPSREQSGQVRNDSTNPFRHLENDQRVMMLPGSKQLNPLTPLPSKSMPSKLSKNRAFGTPDRIAPLRYIKHCGHDHEIPLESDVYLTRHDILERLASDGASIMHSNRVALTGPVGIGKTYIAMGFVNRLTHQFKNTPIFWVSAETDHQLQEDCKAITDLMGLKPPNPGTKPWNWLCKILRRISNTLSGSWMMVLDGVVPTAETFGIHKFCETQEGKHGYVLMTTRHLDVAERFIGETGLRVDVGAMDTSHAANLLGEDATVPLSPIFDELAQSLEFGPLAIVNTKAFLKMTGMPARNYADYLAAILNNDNWTKGRQLASVAQGIITGCHTASDTASADLQSESSALFAVIRSCINPSWYLLFDQLESELPAAIHVLSMLSVFGRRTIPKVLLSTNAAITGDANVLIDRSLLTLKLDTIEANRIMLIAHRVWLLGHDRLEFAHQSALRTIACVYPDAAFDVNWHQCESLEPFAKTVLAGSSQSWIEADHTSKWFRVMLLGKRGKFLRLSGTSVGESKDMMEAEIAELEVIHDLDSSSNPSS